MEKVKDVAILTKRDLLAGGFRLGKIYEPSLIREVVEALLELRELLVEVL